MAPPDDPPPPAPGAGGPSRRASPASPASPAEWTTALALLDEALQQPDAARASWLAALTPPHQPLRPLLQQLLDDRARIETAGFLQALPPLLAAEPGAPAAGRWQPGDRLGPWALRRLLGEGGMASVWLAERADGAHARPVALKLPQQGPRGPALAQRFARERAILSTLSHPHIAGVLDAGEHDGQPWLAMALVEGRTLTDHATAQQLDVPARLRLFLQVLQAVAHAHAQLVIHRDLKPSNVLVDAAGQVQLLDFGVATLLGDDGATPDSALTQQGGRAMTPQYASPEQLAGTPLGTASDVYSLGVLMHELLTGQLPYTLRRPSAAALEAAILAADAQLPSQAVTDPRLRRALRGDLDSIVRKAMALQPAQRYASADALAQDIERHLQHQPISARPAGWAYRTGRALRRHRVVVATASAVAVALLGGASVAAWQARQAQAAAVLAQQQAQRAQGLRDVLVDLLHAGDPATLGGRPPGQTTLVELLSRAEARLATLPASQDAVRGDLLTTLAELRSSMDDTDGAVRLYQQALAWSRQADGVPHARQAALLSALVGTLLFGNRQAQAAPLNQQLGQVLAQLGDRQSVVYARYLRAQAALIGARDAARHAELRGLLLQATEIFRTQAPGDPGRTGALYLLARVQLSLGDVPAALATADEAVVAAQQAERPQMEQPGALSLRGSIRQRVGALAGALADFQAADARYSASFGDDHFLTLQNRGLLGETQHLLGQREPGLALLQATLARISAVRAGSSTQANAFERLGLAQARDGQTAAALATLDQAVAVWQGLGPDFSRHALAAQVPLLISLGRVDEAQARLQRLQALNQARDGGKPDAATLLAQGQLAAAQGQPVPAAAAFEQALALSSAATRADRERAWTALQALAAWAQARRDTAGALAWQQRAQAVAAEPALRERVALR